MHIIYGEIIDEYGFVEITDFNHIHPRIADALEGFNLVLYPNNYAKGDLVKVTIGVAQKDSLMGVRVIDHTLDNAKVTR